MSRRPRLSRDEPDAAGRIEPRFAARPEPKPEPETRPPHNAPQAPLAPMPQTHAPHDTPAPPAAKPNPNPYALPEHVIPAWVTRPPDPQASPQAEPADAGGAQTPPQAPSPVTETRAADATAPRSYWSKIHVPEEERERAAKAGLYRYVKETAAHETPRKVRAAPPRAMNAAADGKPRIWLTVVALLLLFGAGAYGLSQLADAQYGKQNAEWRPAETAEPSVPGASPSPAPAPGPTPAPAPNFIEVAP